MTPSRERGRRIAATCAQHPRTAALCGGAEPPQQHPPTSRRALRAAQPESRRQAAPHGPPAVPHRPGGRARPPPRSSANTPPGHQAQEAQADTCTQRNASWPNPWEGDTTAAHRTWIANSHENGSRTDTARTDEGAPGARVGGRKTRRPGA